MTTSPSDLKKLIKINSRRLQVLKEKKAFKGIDVEPEVVLEIKDIEQTLDQLKAELAAIENEATRSTQADAFNPDLLEKQLTQMESMETELKSLQKRLKKLQKKSGTSVQQNVSVTGDGNQVFIAGRDNRKS